MRDFIRESGFHPTKQIKVLEFKFPVQLLTSLFVFLFFDDALLAK